jgi:membrane fusion protein (multidrug efflux system)
VDTVRVQFFITENQYIALARQSIQDVENLRDNTTERPANLELVLSDGTPYNYKGSFDFIDRGIDPTTGAILIQASFPNPEGFLRPGQFAQIRSPMQNVGETILVPQRSVMELQGKHQVYVVNDSNKVVLKEFERGPRYYNFWVADSGLTPGEKVIYEGLQKVRPGIMVKTEKAEVSVIKESM